MPCKALARGLRTLPGMSGVPESVISWGPLLVLDPPKGRLAFAHEMDATATPLLGWAFEGSSGPAVQ